MREKYVIKKRFYKGYLIILYFLIIFFFFFAFSLNIYIPEKYETYGVISNYVQEKAVYSNYKGRIKNIYFYEDSDIIKGQNIIDIYIENNENVKRENKIKKLKLLLSNKSINNEDRKNYTVELKSLETIKNHKTIYFNPPYGNIFTVKDLFVKKNQVIDYQQKLFTYDDTKESNLFYIESFIDPEIFNNINEEDKVIIDFYELPDKTLKYEARINKKHSQIFQSDIVLQKTNGKINNFAYKVDIRLINYPKNIKSGLGVNVSIIRGEISLFYYLVNYFKENYEL